MSRLREHLVPGAAIVAVVLACAAASGGGSSASPDATASSAPQDTSGLIPAGYGALRQDDISIHLTYNGLNIQAMPMDENFLRTLAPDSYRNLAALRESKRAQLDSIGKRAGSSGVAVWYVTFRNTQQGEAPFAPGDVTVTNVGREFHPLDVIGLSAGFSQHRLRQNETAIGLLVFDSAINPNQDLTLRLETQTSVDWQTILQRVERERSLVRSRAISKRGGLSW